MLWPALALTPLVKQCLFTVINLPLLDTDGYQEQLQSDSQFLCSDQRMDTELVDRLVLQLNRIYPQILSDKEAHRVTAAICVTQTKQKHTVQMRAVTQCNLCLPAVQEPKRAHQGAVSRPLEAPAQKRRRGMPWILQSPSHPYRGHLL